MKYPLATVEALLNVFSTGIGGGCDIRCQFHAILAHVAWGTMLRQSIIPPWLGYFIVMPITTYASFFYLVTYVKGMGLEDLEGCECFFSRSNTLVSSVRYASVFHQHQEVAEYMKHLDAMETSQNLSKCGELHNAILT